MLVWKEGVIIPNMFPRLFFVLSELMLLYVVQKIQRNVDEVFLEEKKNFII